MREWNELNDYEQVNLWWEYLGNLENEEDVISFEEFDEMMQGFTFE